MAPSTCWASARGLLLFRCAQSQDSGNRCLLQRPTHTSMAAHSPPILQNVGVRIPASLLQHLQMASTVKHGILPCPRCGLGADFNHRKDFARMCKEACLLCCKRSHKGVPCERITQDEWYNEPLGQKWLDRVTGVDVTPHDHNAPQAQRGRRGGGQPGAGPHHRNSSSHRGRFGPAHQYQTGTGQQ